MTDLLIQEKANIYVGDDDADNSKHLSLASVKLPDLEEIMQTQHGGGSLGEIEIGGLGLKMLKPSFKVNGWDPQSMAQFGVTGRTTMPFTVYGSVRDQDTGRLIETRAIIFGRITKAAQDEFKSGDLLGHDFEISSVRRYQVFFDKSELWYYDWKTTVWRVKGVVQNADERAILRIPT